MLCKNCEYRLWNLTSRICPECGAPFAPSDFNFVPGSVRFCCPHCAQEYYGTALNGHLVPFDFDCVRCSRHITMDEMVLLPAEGLEEEQTQFAKLPWLERKKRGFFRAWFSTLGMALVRPGEAIAMTPAEGAVASCWGFALFTALVTLCVGAAPFLIMFAGFAPLPGGAVFAPLLTTLGTLLLMVLGGLIVWGLSAHALLLLTGRKKGGIGRTYQSLCLSSGANIVSAVPCLGLYVGWLWWLISAVIMVKAGQRVGGLRAALAVLALPLCALIGGGVWFGYQFNAAMTTARSASTMNETSAVADAIMSYAEMHDYRGPKHGLQLVVDGFLEGGAFTIPASATIAEEIPVGAGSLYGFNDAEPAEQRRLAAAAAAGLPAGVIAHRVGDFVFTYHGAVLNECPADLWIVIQSHDPDALGADPVSQSTLLVAGKADGALEFLVQAALASALKKQNELRAGLNLPPLPDPATVTHDQPAIAGAQAAEAADTTP
jgi:hypothetical protein